MVFSDLLRSVPNKSPPGTCYDSRESSIIATECIMWQSAYRSAVFILAAALSTACAHTSEKVALRIDGSTPQAFQASWDRLHSSLTRQQQSQLDLALLPIALGKYKSFTEVPPTLLTTGIGPQTIRAELDGLSFKEIIELAHRQPIKMNAPSHTSTS